MNRIWLHRQVVLVMIATIAFALSACGSGSEPEGLPTEIAPIATIALDVATATPPPVATLAPTKPPAPTDTPQVIADSTTLSATDTIPASIPVTETAGVTATVPVSEPLAAHVFFRQPTLGAILPPTSTIIIGVEGLTVEPAGEVKAGSGHLHILLDSEFVAPGTAIPKDAQHIHLGSGALMTDVVLSPGEHTLRLQFADGAHIALAGDEYRAEIQVEIAENATAQSVRFVSPADGATVSSPFTVTMAATGLIIEPAGDVHVDAGHLHILVDSDFIAAGDAIPKDETHLHFGKGQLSASLSLPPGTHTLRLQFADGAHVALDGEQYQAEMSVTVQ